jgi:hypothetical protein
MSTQHASQSQAETCPKGLSEKDTRRIEERLAWIAFEGPAAIERRLAELDREWSAGRAAKVVVGGGTLGGLAAALLVSLWWLALPVLLGLILLQYLVGRECWLTQGLKWLGLRNGIEIEHERLALKALRGDFRHLPIVHDRADADALARLEGEGGIADQPPALHEQNSAAVKEVLDRIDSHA